MLLANTSGYDGFTLDIQVFDKHGDGEWAQARYLVHGIDDVLWTDSINDAINYLRIDLKRLANAR